MEPVTWMEIKHEEESRILDFGEAKEAARSNAEEDNGRIQWC